MLIQGHEILKKLGLLPDLVKLEILEKENENSILTALFRVSSKILNSEKEWIKNKDILSLLRIKLVFFLNSNKNSFNISDIFKLSSNNLIQIIDFPLELNNAMQKDIASNGEVRLSTTFEKSLSLQQSIKHLDCMIVLYLDNRALATKYNISIESFKDKIFATHSFLSLIKNDEIVDKTRVVKINSFFEKLKINLQFQSSNNDSSLRIFSEELHSLSKNNENQFILLINLKNAFVQNSIFSSFFQNQQFQNQFFSKYNKPQKITIKRKSKTQEITLYEGEYKSFINNDKICLQETLSNFEIFSFGITDYNSKNLINDYIYDVELQFTDKTIDYFLDIKNTLQINSSKLSTLVNLIQYKNYYNFELKCFDERFFDLLKIHNFSIESIAKNFVDSIDKLTSLIQKDKNLNTLFSSKNITIEHIEQLQIAHNSLLSELTLLENLFLKRKASTFSLNKTFILSAQKFEHSVQILNNNSDIIPVISIKDVLNRFNEEVLKYYTTLNSVRENLILTPYKIVHGQYSMYNNKNIGQMNFDEYNNFFIHSLSQKNATSDELLLILKEKLQINVTQDIDNLNNLFIVNDIDSKDVPIDLLLFLYVQSSLLDQDKFIRFFDALNSNNSRTKINKNENIQLPIQLQAITNTFENNVYTTFKENKISNINGTNSIALFMNFCSLFQLQILDFSNFNLLKWKNIKSLKDISQDCICRWQPYYNENFYLTEQSFLNFQIQNQIFIVKKNEN